MTTPPLWEMPARPAGRMRAALDAMIDLLRTGGADVPEDLAIVAQSLADRIDAANAGGDRRGYVMLTAEYRAARADLLEGVVTSATGSDPLEQAWAEFSAAASGDAP